MTSTKLQARTLALDVALMVVAGFAPAMVMGAFGWSSGASVAVLAGLAAFIACMGGNGWRSGLIIAVPFAVLAGLADWAAPNPWLAAVIMAIAAFLRGYAARIGLHDSLVTAVIALGYFTASPPASDTSMAAPLFVALVSLGAALWATFVLFLLRKRIHPHHRPPLNRIRVLAYSLALAFLIGVATWFVVYFKLGHTGGWIILTILIVFQPSLGDGFTKAANRAAGTILGFGIALVIALVLPAGAPLYIVGTVLLMVAFLFMLQGRVYWLYAAVLTPAIVLLESAGTTVDKVAEERLFATLIGVAGTLVVMLALTPLSKYFSDKDEPQHR